MSSKFEIVEDHVLTLFSEVKNETSIPDYVKFEVRSNDKQRKIWSIAKSGEKWEKITDGVNFVVVINERAFNLLDAKSQKVLLEECLGGVQVSDKGVSLVNPDFNTHSGMLMKYGHEEMIKTHEIVKSVYDQIKEEDDAEKAIIKKRSKKSY